jgi:hypothetical protein
LRFHPVFFAVRRSPVDARKASAYSDTIPSRFGFGTQPKERKMNVLKHMEAIFLAAAFLVVGTSYANAAGAVKQVRYDSQVSVEGQQMAVVKVSAKRLSALDKAGA